jgi:hypothetical protein
MEANGRRRVGRGAALRAHAGYQNSGGSTIDVKYVRDLFRFNIGSAEESDAVASLSCMFPLPGRRSIVPIRASLEHRVCVNTDTQLGLVLAAEAMLVVLASLRITYCSGDRPLSVPSP